MPTSAPETPSLYRPALDGVRALCIVLTLENHLQGQPSWINGTLGVDVFFALSGWLITWLLLREKRDAGNVSLRSFYIRRAFRIAPLYYLTILAYVLAVPLAAKFMGRLGGPDHLRQALISLLTFNREYAMRPGLVFGHAWTLGVEEKFYILWPAILVLTRMRIGVALACSCLVCLALLGLSGFNDRLIRGYCGLGFGAGLAVCAVHYPWLIARLERAGTQWFALGVLALAYTASIVWPYVVWNIVVSGGGALFVASLWFNSNTPISKVLSLTPLVWVGRLTYAIYLLHVLVVEVTERVLTKFGAGQNALLQFLSAYGASIVVAFVAHRIVERPMVRVGRRLASTFRPAPGGGRRKFRTPGP